MLSRAEAYPRPAPGSAHCESILLPRRPVARVPASYEFERAKLWPGQIPGSHEPGFEEPELRELPPPKELRWLKRASEELHCFAFGECTVLLSREDSDHGGLRWHLSISHPHRHPSWDEIKTARYRLCGPDLVMAMILPRAEDYVNVPAQDHVMQLWELIGAEAEGW